VHSQDGLDEISIAANTDVTELSNGHIKTYELNPVDYGIKRQPITSCIVQNSDESYELLLNVLNNEKSPALDLVLLNAGATLYVADIVPDIQSGITLAQQVIENGAAKEKFDALISLSQRLQRNK
jgi:anthranilate phosphoribosyltransferase